jgi:transposase
MEGAAMSTELRARQETLRQLSRTDPDPRVRRRAHALLLLSEGHAVVAVARLFATAPHRVRTWRSRFLAGGRQGLADEPRTGRPPKLDSAALAFLEEALEASPQTYGLPVTVWSIRDLRAVLAHRLGVQVCPTTVHRAVQRLGFRYRRPRHDLRHRQDHEAVAATTEILAWLRKKALTPPAPFASSTWMSARSTATPGWQKCGNDEGVR